VRAHQRDIGAEPTMDSLSVEKPTKAQRVVSDVKARRDSTRPGLRTSAI